MDSYTRNIYNQNRRPLIRAFYGFSKFFPSVSLAVVNARDSAGDKGRINWVYLFE